VAVTVVSLAVIHFALGKEIPPPSIIGIVAAHLVAFFLAKDKKPVK
jgi:hypothetical protein